MIRFICGKPGSGKGVVLTEKFIIDELLHGDRPIICYFALKFEPWVRMWKRFGVTYTKPEIGLRAYLKSTYGKDFDLDKRIFLLPEEEAIECYLWRVVDGKLVKLEESKIKRDNKGRVDTFEHSLIKDTGGHMYIFDEVQRFVPARSFASTPEGLLTYSQLHRHAGDDVLFATQHTKFVDVALTRVAQEFWLVRNHGKMKLGLFRQPDIFSVSIYDQAPGGMLVEPMERKVFRLDKAGIGGCFDTTGGLRSGAGFGSAGDLFERKSGLPWWMIIVLLVAVAIVFIKIPTILGWMFGHHIKKEQQITAVEPRNTRNAGEPRISTFRSLDKSETSVLLSNSSPTAVEHGKTNEVWATGYILWPDVKVFLSDGRIAESKFNEVQKIYHYKVRVFDQDYELKPAPYIPLQYESRNFQNENSADIDTYQNASSGYTTIPDRHNARPPLTGIQNRMGNAQNVRQPQR